MTPDDLRALLPAVQRAHFFDYAATAPMLAPAAEEIARIARQGMEPLSGHFEEWLALVEQVRARVAGLIGAQSDEIAFTGNTSSALSLIAGALPWQPGNTVIFPADEFPSNRYVWQNLGKRGVNAVALPPETDRSLLDQLRHRDLSSVRLVALSAVSYRDGQCHDIPAICRLCHDQGVLVAVDGIQAAGAIPIDVRAWGCAFLACGAQKWLLGPVGAGFLYVRADLIENLHVPLVGWASVRTAGACEVQRLEFASGARRFEPGLPDVAVIAGLGKSLETLAAVGWRAVFDRVAEVNARLREELVRQGYRLVVDRPGHSTAGIIALDMGSEGAAQDFREECREKRIVLTQRDRLIRIAAHAPVSEHDVQTLLRLTHRWASRRNRAVSGIRLDSGQEAPRPEVLPGMPHREGVPPHALVTGASRGLGRAIAMELARRGYRVTLLGRDSAVLSELARQLAEEWGHGAEAVMLDLARLDEVEHWLAEAVRDDTFDTLINNAATAEARPFVASTAEEWEQALAVNLLSPLMLCRRLLPGMLRRGRGRILNVVTTGARCAFPLFSSYSASKGALWAWSEALGRELRGRGIVVTTFLPPHMPTATAHHLARAAAASYRTGGASAPKATPARVAAQAVDALEKGLSFVAPWPVRARLALNALLPDRIARRVDRVWTGLPEGAAPAQDP